MFNVGEKVCCIVDGWDGPGVESVATSTPFPLERNQIVTVLAVYPANTDFGLVKAKTDLISIGVENSDLRVWSRVIGFDLPDYDIWPDDWFRRLERKDISEGLATLIGLFDTTKAPEGVSA